MKVGLKMEHFSAQDLNLRCIYKDTSNRLRFRICIIQMSALQVGGNLDGTPKYAEERVAKPNNFLAIGREGGGGQGNRQ